MEAILSNQDYYTLNQQIVPLEERKKRSKKIAIVVKTGILFLGTDEIVRLETIGKQVMIVTQNGEEYLTSKTLKDFEEILDDSVFIRVHQSYIINVNYVRKYNKQMNYIEMEDKSRVELSRRKKDTFFDAFFYI